MIHRLAGLLLATTLLLVLAPAALAVPVTVNVRVEGSASTLFEGPVTTDGKLLETPSSGGPHPCNVGENITPQSATRAATPTTALADGARSVGLPWDATWSPTFTDFLVTRIGPDVADTAFWGVAVNYQPLEVGGCQFAVSPGANVLWAFDMFGKRLLRLDGPATAEAGAAAIVTVRDGQTGAAVAGATVGGATTDASGNARVTFTQTGLQRLKAEAPGSVRSNALVVCVHRGQDGTCGSPVSPGADTQGVAGVTTAAVDRTAPRARVRAPRDGRRYRRSRYVPRVIRGTVAESGSGILMVKMKLTRRLGDRCWSYSGRRERFIGQRCGRGFFFRMGTAATFDYLLPEKLARGRYVLDVVAVDKAFNRDTARKRGRNRVVFEVR